MACCDHCGAEVADRGRRDVAPDPAAVLSCPTRGSARLTSVPAGGASARSHGRLFPGARLESSGADPVDATRAYGEVEADVEPTLTVSPSWTRSTTPRYLTERGLAGEMIAHRRARGEADVHACRWMTARFRVPARGRPSRGRQATSSAAPTAGRCRPLRELWPCRRARAAPRAADRRRPWRREQPALVDGDERRPVTTQPLWRYRLAGAVHADLVQADQHDLELERGRQRRADADQAGEDVLDAWPRRGEWRCRQHSPRPESLTIRRTTGTGATSRTGCSCASSSSLRRRGAEAAGLNLDQQVAADEVDDEPVTTTFRAHNPPAAVPVLSQSVERTFC